MIRDFARNVVSIKAESAGHSIEITKVDTNTWQCEPCSGPLTVAYQVYAWDLSVRAAHLDTTHAFFNGTSVFLLVHGQEDKPCQVEILPPSGDAYTQWRVATAMQTAGAKLYGFGLYQAGNYDELVDHPVEIGDFTLANFEAGGIPHDIVITGRHRTDLSRLCHDLQTICNSHIHLFGELPDIKRYVFLIMAVGQGYGGLEHRSSTSLLCSRNDLPLPGIEKVTEEYRTFLGLCSHEYFHTWNVKQIKPAAFVPYDLLHENHTRQLWAFEGITSYYDDLALVRSGIIEPDSYLELLGQVITRVWRGQGRFKQSVAESSFDTWTKFYKQDESAPNNIVSYYTKGSLIALALDLTIRLATQNKYSLDDLMRRLWQQFGKTDQGVTEKEIEALARNLVGQDLSDFFNRYLYGAEDPPLKELLAEFGIIFNLRPASTADDKGGKPADSEAAHPITGLGARLDTENCGVRLVNVYDNGPAQLAGLSAGDIIFACNNIKVDKTSLEKLINTSPPGSQIMMHAFRRDELHTFNVVLQIAPDDTCYLEINNSAPSSKRQFRQQWLGS